jgi:hypothetical protein
MTALKRGAHPRCLSPSPRRRLSFHASTHTSQQQNPADMRALLAHGPQGLGALPRGRGLRPLPALKVAPCASRCRRAIEQQQQGPAPSPFGTLRSPAANAVGSAAAFPLQPATDPSRLQHLCKSVLIGLGVAALWSIAAAAFTGSGGPLASLSVSTAGGSSVGECLGRAPVAVDSTQPPADRRRRPPRPPPRRRRCAGAHPPFCTPQPRSRPRKARGQDWQRASCTPCAGRTTWRCVRRAH